jgi:hypothetical protein
LKSNILKLLVAGSICVSAFGLGFRISPGTILLNEAPVGKPYDFATERNQAIRIGPVNYDMTYELHAEPAGAGNSSATGYFDFLNPEWFSLAAETVFISAGDVAEVPMWLNIAEDEGLYNHHWLLGIPVTPISVGGATQIQVGGYLQFRFETEAKAGVVPQCAQSELVAVPSTIKFEDMMPGMDRIEIAELYHGRQHSLMYRVERLDPDSDVARITILGTPGYPRLEHPEWIEYPTEAVVPGSDEGGGPFPITVKIPQGEQVRRFEEILLLKNNQTKTAFIRILVNIKQI